MTGTKTISEQVREIARVSSRLGLAIAAGAAVIERLDTVGEDGEHLNVVDQLTNCVSAIDEVAIGMIAETITGDEDAAAIEAEDLYYQIVGEVMKEEEKK